MSGKRGKHQSLSKGLKRSVGWLENRPGVRKIVLGLSEACRHRRSPGCLSVQRATDAGLHLNGYSGTGVVRLFLVCDADRREELASAINERFS
ncbi:hypothetical protein [Alienimonas californiensis]|uniref:Uncharacterized protein n=1 Tax=Alienimonas californiensis TaxID=2527989 RepID=A0A517PCM0_9PLAN|nr:hypothetical protein [Alienimonas californiensis]QDT17115.1 hypothetical protein CA12_32270 [Alienimonas californiensis]